MPARALRRGDVCTAELRGPSRRALAGGADVRHHGIVIPTAWAWRGLAAASVAFPATATLVWLSGVDMLIGLLFPCVIVAWAILGAFTFVISRRTADTAPRWRRVLAAGAAAAVTVGTLGALGVPAAVRFAASARELANAGQRVLDGGSPGRAGLYGFSSTRVYGGCAILVTQNFFIDEYGWAYCPSGPPEIRLVHKERFELRRGNLYAYAFED